MSAEGDAAVEPAFDFLVDIDEIIRQELDEGNCV